MARTEKFKTYFHLKGLWSRRIRTCIHSQCALSYNIDNGYRYTVINSRNKKDALSSQTMHRNHKHIIKPKLLSMVFTGLSWRNPDLNRDELPSSPHLRLAFLLSSGASTDSAISPLECLHSFHVLTNTGIRYRQGSF